MSNQTVIWSIPESLFAEIRERAERKNRSVEAEAVEVLATGIAVKQPEAAPCADAAFQGIGTEAWGEMNLRRVALIHKKNREGLSQVERMEYDRLQQLTEEALEKAFPPSLPFAERLDRLEEKLRGQSETTPP